MSTERAGSDRFLFYGYLALLLWAPLPLGSNRPWAWSLMEIWVFLLALVWVALYWRKRVLISRSFIAAWAVSVCLLATAIWAFVQTLPLPATLLGMLSPQALEITAATQSYPSLSLDVYATRQGTLKTLSYLVIFCLTLLLVNDKSRIRTLLQVILVSGVFQAAYGALMTLSGLEYGFFVEKEYGIGLATGTFVNRNHLAGHLEMALAAGVGLMLSQISNANAANWRDSVRRLLRTLLGSKARVRLALVILVTGLVLTRSRMGNIAFVASLMIASAFYMFAVRKLSARTIVFFASLLIVDLIVVGNFFGIERVTERLERTSAETEDRDERARDTLVMLQDFPLAGIGLGSFYAVYPMYTTGIASPGFTEHAHNDYLQFATELGLPVAAALGAAVLASLAVAVLAQLRRRDPLLQGAAFAASMAMLALLIHSAVDFNLQIPANAALFVVMMALAWICRHWDRLAPTRGTATRARQD